jgi:hypothetical protein
MEIRLIQWLQPALTFLAHLRLSKQQIKLNFMKEK